MSTLMNTALSNESSAAAYPFRLSAMEQVAYTEIDMQPKDALYISVSTTNPSTGLSTDELHNL